LYIYKSELKATNDAYAGVGTALFPLSTYGINGEAYTLYLLWCSLLQTPSDTGTHTYVYI
jgi:hypothetical protein